MFGGGKKEKYWKYFLDALYMNRNKWMKSTFIEFFFLLNFLLKKNIYKIYIFFFLISQLRFSFVTLEYKQYTYDLADTVTVNYTSVSW